MEDNNPYQAPMASSVPDADNFAPGAHGHEELFVEGLRQPMPNEAFDGAYNQAWDSLSGNAGSLLGLSFLIMVLSTMSQRIDSALYELDTGPVIIITSLVLSCVFTLADVGVRMQLMMRWLATIRFQNTLNVRGAPTGRQMAQGAILSVPFFVMFAMIAATELTPEESVFQLVFIGGSILTLIGALLFNLLAIPAMMFIVDQDVSALEGLRRAGKMILGNFGGWVIFVILIPVVMILGLIALCLGTVVSTAIIHGAFAIAYNRVAQPGNAYMTVVSDIDTYGVDPDPPEPW